jgi:hypothetical protein
MREHTRTFPRLALALAGSVAAMGLWSSQAQGAGALWVSAPNWSYSAAAAESPLGWAYFWGLSVGPGTYSFAYAFSNDGAGDAAYAFAEAAVAQGGMGAVQVAGLADPFAGGSIDIPLIDPSLPGGYPETKPGSDPFSSSYTVDAADDKITFTGSGQELNGADELEAFTYNGNTDMASLEAELGASSDSGTGNTGDVTDFADLTSDFGLVPLDAPILDPSSLTELDFTENDSSIDPSKVILVGMDEAESPEPASLALIGLAGLTTLSRRRRPA